MSNFAIFYQNLCNFTFVVAIQPPLVAKKVELGRKVYFCAIK